MPPVAVLGGFKALCDAFERARIAQKNAKPLLYFLRRLIEPLGRLDARAHLVALRLGGEKEEHRGARLQRVAILHEAFGKDHRLILPGGVGQPDDPHLVAGLGAALHA